MYTCYTYWPPPVLELTKIPTFLPYLHLPVCIHLDAYVPHISDMAVLCFIVQ